jgi:3-hydroxybutyryl-CoA dehydrogenase
MTVPDTIGVIGAGTMGSGIAQLAAMAGARTLLHDPVEEALHKGAAAAQANLDKGAQRGRWSAADAEAAKGRLAAAPSLADLGPCGLVIEAAPEKLELKQRLFAELSGILAPDAVLATNTSSLLVTAIATGAARPDRVVGMHFFNPAPLMRLLEVVAGEESSEEALEIAVATGEAMGKRVIVAADGPGFLVNRCNRPFLLEALRLLQERIAGIETIDRIVRQGGGFRMGPFELSDLVGVDIGYEISKSFFEQSFGEPRWRPSPIAARMAAAGRHGRKSGRGYYDYGDGPHRPDDPDPAAGGSGGGLVVIAGDGVVADELARAGAVAGWDVAPAGERPGEVPELILDCRLAEDEDDPVLEGGPRALLCAAGSLAALDVQGNAAGFHFLPPLAGSSLVELTTTDATADAAEQAAMRFFTSLGKHVVDVGDAPGLVLGRIVCQVINEAAFAVGEGLGSVEDVDAGMLLGLNHPHGPLAWADVIGLDHVLAVLDGLADEYREERYRAAPLLRRLVLEGRLGRQVGAGFAEHPE